MNLKDISLPHMLKIFCALLLLLAGVMPHLAAQNHNPDVPPDKLGFQWQDASGWTFRQVGTTGRPFRQAAPQSEAETDEEPEESYIDAMTRHFNHDTSDVYIPLSGNELALAVKRSATGEIWRNQYSLKPEQRPDRPFGVGWTSGLTANVEVVAVSDGADYVLVTDENGSTHKFSAVTEPGSSGLQRSFVPLPSNRTQQESFFMRLVATYVPVIVQDGNGNDVTTYEVSSLVFKRKFGTELHFEPDPVIRYSINTGSGSSEVHTFYRLDFAIDRVGNTISYSFDNANTLIPSTITGTCGGGASRTITITRHNSANPRTPIATITYPGANGSQTITYDYGDATGSEPSGGFANNPVTFGGSAVWYLRKMTDARGNVRSYKYEAFGPESDSTPFEEPPPSPTFSYHINISEFRSEGPQDLPGSAGAGGASTPSAVYSISYAADRSSYRYSAVTENYYVPTGVQRIVSSFSGPSGTVTVTGSSASNGTAVRLAFVDGLFVVEGERSCTFTDTAGNDWTYKYSNPKYYDMEEFEGLFGQSDPKSFSTLIAWRRLKVSTGDFSETVNFNPDKGYAETSRIDASGNTVTYQHSDPIDVGEFFPWAENIPLPEGGTLADHPIFPQYYKDPTKEIREFTEPWPGGQARQAVKEFVYYSSPNSRGGFGDSGPAHKKSFARVMTKIIDANGNTTTYALDSTTGQRVSEEVRDAQNTVLKFSEYEYDSQMHAFVTEETLALGGGTGLVQNTVYTPDRDSGKAATKTVYVDDPRGADQILEWEYEYDGAGNLIEDRQVLTTGDRVTTFDYDDLNHLIRTNYPQSGNGPEFVETGYDGRGNQVWSRDEEGRYLLRVFDTANRKLRDIVDMDGDEEESSGDLITQYTYNPVGWVTTVTSPEGRVTKTEYDALQRKTAVVAGFGTADARTTSFLYTGANSGTRISNPDSFAPTKITDSRGYVTLKEYDELYRNWKDTSFYAQTGETGATAVTIREFDLVGNLVRQTDPANSISEFEYNGLNQAIEGTIAKGTAVQKVTNTTYTCLGWPTAVEEQVTTTGYRTTNTLYDSLGRERLVIMPNPANGVGSTAANPGDTIYPVTEKIYDLVGDLVQTKGPRGFATDYVYDNRGRKLQDILPLVNYVDESGTWITGGSRTRSTVTTTFDKVGNVRSVADARGHTSVSFYDAANRVIGTISPAATVDDPLVGTGSVSTYAASRMVYDRDGNVLETWLGDAPNQSTYGGIDGLRRTALNTYTVHNQLSSTKDAEDITVTNLYDAAGNLEYVTDGKSQTTRFYYDGLNRNTRTEYPAGPDLVYEYDAMYKTARVDGQNRRTEYEYDAQHRLSEVNYIGRSADDFDYAYDRLGNIISVTHSPANPLRDVVYELDYLGRRVRETSVGVTHETVYDVAGNIASVEYAEGTGSSRILTSTYDELNRLSTMTEGGRVTYNRYDRNGNVRYKGLDNSGSIHYVYDKLNRREIIASYEYEYTHLYDLGGNLRVILELYPNNTSLERVVTNTYDAINRLTREAVAATTNVITDYVYDDAHNRTDKVVIGGSGAGTWEYNYNGLNQLTDYTGPSTSVVLTYDGAGNRETRTVNSGTPDTYTYDYENRLVQLVQGGTTYQYAYDYRTRRVRRVEGVTTTDIVFNGGTSVREIESSAITVEYVRGSDYGGGVGGILYTLRDDAAPGVNIVATYNHYNNRGDVTSQADEAGIATYVATYEAFGTRTQESGSTPDRQKANTKEEDPTGLLNEGFRYRDLETGTFLTRDPAGFVDGPNLYTYVNQNPWSAFDPAGLESRTVAQWHGILPFVQANGDIHFNGANDNVNAGINALVETFVPDVFKAADELGDGVGRGSTGDASGWGDAAMAGLDLGTGSKGKKALNAAENVVGVVAKKSDDVAEIAVKKSDDIAETAQDTAKKGPIQPNEVTTYKDFNDRSVVGDNLEGHELLQHANLNERGLATTRLSTDASKNNPVIALDKTVHAEVNAAQRSLNPRAQSGADNISANAQILRKHPKIPKEAVDKAEEMARRHDDSLE